MTSEKEIQLVFATHNPNKIKEIQGLLPQNVRILSLEEIGCNEEIHETGETLVENAFQKADFVKEKFGYDCFADDTGLEVEELNGAPGVLSARYAGEEKNSEANIGKLLKELLNKKNRKAEFKTVIALNRGSEKIHFTGSCKGEITTEKRGRKGFGYDPVFQPEGSSLTFAEMELEEKSKFSHRSKAVAQLIDYLQKSL